jgi:hypothetical protein
MPPPPPLPLGIATSYRRESLHLPASQSSRLRKPFQASSLTTSINTSALAKVDHVCCVQLPTRLRSRPSSAPLMWILQLEHAPWRGRVMLRKVCTQLRWTSRATGRSDHTHCERGTWLGCQFGDALTRARPAQPAAGPSGALSLEGHDSRAWCSMISGAVPVRTLDHVRLATFQQVCNCVRAWVMAS